MSERNCRVSDGTGWYTDHRDEHVVAEQLANRLKMIGKDKISTLKFYYLGPKEELPEEKRDRILSSALDILSQKPN